MDELAFSESKGTRLSTKQTKQIEQIIKKYERVKYQNISHFIRCAVDKLIKEELNK